MIFDFFHRYVYWKVMHVSYDLSKSLNLIGFRGDIKGNFWKILKNLPLRNHKGNEAET